MNFSIVLSSIIVDVIILAVIRLLGNDEDCAAGKGEFI